MTAADKIAEARALIEPLTGHDDGPWSIEEDDWDGLCITTIKRLDECLVPIAKIGVDYDEPFETRQQSCARLIAAAPVLCDTVAALADLADAQAQEIARLKQRIEAMVSALGLIALMPHSDECSSHIDDEDFPCDCHVGPADAALGDAP